MNKNLYSKASLGILVAGFMFFVIVINLFFSWARFDLTEDKLYSISKGSTNIVEKIDEPITLNFFFSTSVTEEQNLPFWRNYAKRVREFLQEYELLADGKIRLNFIDPEPFSEAEDQAAEYGLQAVPVPSGDELYFGLVGTNSVDLVEKIPFFDPRKEQFLEYDISKLIYKLLNTRKPVIGLLSGLPVNGGMDMQTRQPRPAWVIFEQAKQLFEVRELQNPVDKLDDDLDVLMLVHPKGLSEQTRYAIDQFVMAGGKTMIFVDPNAEQDRMPQSPQNPFPQTVKGDDLNDLFNAWGFKLPMDKVVVDRGIGLEVGSGRGGRPVKHIGILGLQQANLDLADVALANLEQVIVSTPGHVLPMEGNESNVIPLVQSTEQASLLDSSRFSFLPDPSVLLKDYTPSGDRYTIVARISGKAKSAFVDGKPASESTESSGKSDTNSHLAESMNGINVLVFADSDMLANQFWVRVQQFLGSQIAQAFADNGDMILNSIENMAGSSELIGLRGRGRYTRPFEKVEQLKLEAEEKFRKKEQELQQRLSETEQQLSQLTAQMDDSGRVMLTPEQELAIEQFQQQKLLIRKQLRDVQHQLEKDIQSLGTKIKVINIGIVPLLLILIAIATSASRRSKRKKTSEKAA